MTFHQFEGYKFDASSKMAQMKWLQLWIGWNQLKSIEMDVSLYLRYRERRLCVWHGLESRYQNSEWCMTKIDPLYCGIFRDSLPSSVSFSFFLHWLVIIRDFQKILWDSSMIPHFLLVSTFYSTHLKTLASSYFVDWLVLQNIDEPFQPFTRAATINRLIAN